MIGAELLVRAWLAGDTDTQLVDPAPSETHLEATLDHVPSMQRALGFFQGAMGRRMAAISYSRSSWQRSSAAALPLVMTPDAEIDLLMPPVELDRLSPAVVERCSRPMTFLLRSETAMPRWCRYRQKRLSQVCDLALTRVCL
jgi:hypothetical protein